MKVNHLDFPSMWFYTYFPQRIMMNSQPIRLSYILNYRWDGIPPRTEGRQIDQLLWNEKLRVSQILVLLILLLLPLNC